MPRAFLLVMDSVGIGGAPDADQFFNDGIPDTGANTVGHIAQTRGLKVPTLEALGLGAALQLASGSTALSQEATGAWGAAREVSRGKDTPSGHWELAGVPVPWDWTYLPNNDAAIPAEIVAKICDVAGTSGILGNRHSSGTVILEEEAEAHIRTGWPICYTSADSVLQIAAHEEHFGRERLIALCEAVAPMVHERRIGRVIARPFIGTKETGWQRTAYRRDFAIAPPSPTVMNWLSDAGRCVHGIGKIGDIFSMQGLTDCTKGTDAELMEHLFERVQNAAEGSFTFANFVEFDSLYGHRRDVEGYARHLEWFDAAMARLLPQLQAGDLLIITADHGNDPTWHGTDHTREQVPVLVYGLGARALGPRAFVDVAASIAHHLGVPSQGPGRSFL